jgi:hypothetical protein
MKNYLHRLIKSGLFIVVLLIAASAGFLPLHAQMNSNSGGLNSGSGGLNSSSGGLNSSAGGGNGFHLANPLGNTSTFCDLLKTIFNVLVIFAIPIAVVMVVYAGFRFVLARGNPEGLKKARVNLVATLLGIALFFGAWFLAQVIANTLVQLGGSSFNTCF